MKRIIIILFFALFCRAELSFGVEVFQGHPRLFFRDSAWGERSLTTEQLRARAKDPRYAAYVNRMNASACEYALRALLLDSQTAARVCTTMLVKKFSFDGTTTDGELVMSSAMAFDWLYNNPVFTDSIKNIAIDNLIQGAKWCKDQYIDQGPHIFHTRMYAFAAGAAMAGLALKGHHPDADIYINWAYDTYLKNLFPARRLQAGSVHNSLAYGRRYTMWHAGHFMSAWYSATGEDLWKMVRREQDDWAWREAEFIMYGRQPDGLLVRYGDCFRRTSERFSFRVIGARAFAYGEPIGANYLNYLFETQAKMPDTRVADEGDAYDVLLWWDADNRGETFTTLPTRTLYSPDGTGMVFWRTGWAEAATYIFFKCGNYFEDHGHFDQGHLEVFRGAPLLIESGAYEGAFDSPYRLNYYRKTIAHNSILAVDPAIPNDEGGQRIYQNQSHATLDSYLADPGCETGDIIDYRDNGQWAYLASDFGQAYPPERVDQVTREVAWLGERYLVVVDNISLANNDLLPKVLWHYTVRPVIEPGRFTVADGGGRAVVTVLAPAAAVIDTVAAYHIGTAYYPPPDPRRELGVGRVEVSVPEAGAYDYTFVQVIDVADEGVKPGEISFRQDQASGGLTVDLPVGTFNLGGSPQARTVVDFQAKVVEPLKGDYNGNGALSVADVVALILLGRENPADPALDFNGDGAYTIHDAVALLRYILKNPGVFLSAAGTKGERIQNLSEADRNYVLTQLKIAGLTVDEWSAVNSIAGPAETPGAFSLGRNTPNPFNPSTLISYAVPSGDPVEVRLGVFSLRGRLVKALAEGRRVTGSYSVHWDGRDESGAALPSGVYFYRLTAGSYSAVRKMVLLR